MTLDFCKFKRTVLDLHDKHLMQFDNLPEALHKIKSATK